MKHLLLFLIVITFPHIAYSQINSDNIPYFAICQYVESLYDTNSKQVVYIEELGEKKHYSLQYGAVSIRIVDASKEKRLYNNAIRKTNGVFHTLSIKHFGNDTIDFVFCKCEVTKDGRRFCISMEDGGDAGYIPSGRFVYDNTKEKWYYYSWKDILGAN